MNRHRIEIELDADDVSDALHLLTLIEGLVLEGYVDFSTASLDMTPIT